MVWNAPNIAFLGVCERATRIEDGFYTKHSIIGLKHVVLSYVFPLPLEGLQLAFAMYDLQNLDGCSIKLQDANGKDITTINLFIRKMDSGDILEPAITQFFHTGNTWTTIVTTVTDIGALILMPGEYQFKLLKNGTEAIIGWVAFVATPALPFTKDRIAALKSSPNASRLICYDLACKKCGDKMSAYVGYEKNAEAEKSGAVWYAELPPVFGCKCGDINIDLSTIRQNLHGWLESTSTTKGGISYANLYENDALQAIHEKFKAVLAQNPPEETIQQFVEDHPVLLHPFSPKRILYKTPILSLFKTDITILTSTKELLLIELEKPATQLIKKNGGMSAEMQRPIDQVNDWMDAVNYHRLAVLDCLKIKREEVDIIRGIVILGRSTSYKPDELRKIRSHLNSTGTTFWTYDDLLGSLGSLICYVGSI